jgi:putative FmdB family regulatory protein
MPTYEYVCDSCGYKFEEFQTMSSEPLETCPVCNGKVHRKIGPGSGLIFKGSGFYITDYKKNKQSSNKKEKSTAVKKKKAG